MDDSKVQEFLQTARDRYVESDEAEDSNRALYNHDVRFENGEQWTEGEKKDRTGRPCVVNNKLAGTVKQILGDARQNRPRIKFRPVDSQADPFIAQIYTGLVRNIENVSDAEDAYDYGHSCAVRGNIGFWRINTHYTDDDSFDQDISIDRIVNTESVHLDQSAVKPTYEDGEYAFISAEIKAEKFKEMYPKASASNWDDDSDMFKAGWFTKETVRIAEYFYKEPTTKKIFMLPDGSVKEIKKPEILQEPSNIGHGLVAGKDQEPIPYKKMRTVPTHKIMWAKISGAEILEGPQEWPGKYIPIVPCLGEEIWIEGERILRSAIRHAIEPQKLYNWAHSNNIETLALSPKQPWILTPEQIGEFKPQWDSAYHRPMPYLLWNFVQGQPPPQRLSGSAADTGAIQLAAMASDDIKATTGIFDASLGARGNETSGKAIRERKSQGGTATYIYTDNQMRAIKYTGKLLADLIPKIYDGERIVRLMGDELQKHMQKHMPQQPAGPNNEPLINFSDDGKEAWVRLNYFDPTLQKTFNDMTIGKYDIVVDAGPGYMTKRQEAADAMSQLLTAVPNYAPIIFPRIAKNLDFPEADEIADEVKAIQQQQSQPPQDPRMQIMAQKGQLDMQKGQMELQKAGMDLEGKKIDLMGKSQQVQMDQRQHVDMMAGIAQQTTLNVLRQLGLVR